MNVIKVRHCERVFKDSRLKFEFSRFRYVTYINKAWHGQTNAGRDHNIGKAIEMFKK